VVEVPAPHRDRRPRSLDEASASRSARASFPHRVDHLRRRRADKRGDGNVPITLDGIEAAAGAPVVDFLIVDEAMTRLAEIKARCADRRVALSLAVILCPLTIYPHRV